MNVFIDISPVCIKVWKKKFYSDGVFVSVQDSRIRHSSFEFLAATVNITDTISARRTSEQLRSEGKMVFAVHEILFPMFTFTTLFPGCLWCRRKAKSRNLFPATRIEGGT